MDINSRSFKHPILFAPSGSGKTTIAKAIVRGYGSDFAFSVSAATRKIRPKEINGVDYYFMRPQVFYEKLVNGEFLETCIFKKNAYGTLKSEVERIEAKSKVVVFDVEINGVLNLYKKMSEKVELFFISTRPETIRKWLVDRGSDSHEDIEERIRIGNLERQKMQTMLQGISYHVIDYHAGKSPDLVANEIINIALKKPF